MLGDPASSAIGLMLDEELILVPEVRAGSQSSTSNPLYVPQQPTYSLPVCPCMALPVGVAPSDRDSSRLLPVLCTAGFSQSLHSLLCSTSTGMSLSSGTAFHRVEWSELQEEADSVPTAATETAQGCLVPLQSPVQWEESDNLPLIPTPWHRLLKSHVSVSLSQTTGSGARGVMLSTHYLHRCHSCIP